MTMAVEFRTYSINHKLKINSSNFFYVLASLQSDTINPNVPFKVEKPAVDCPECRDATGMMDHSLDCPKNSFFFQYISQFFQLTVTYLVNRAAILSHIRRRINHKWPPGSMCDSFPCFIIHEKKPDLLIESNCYKVEG